jgi:hypothetical protein
MIGKPPTASQTETYNRISRYDVRVALTNREKRFHFPNPYVRAPRPLSFFFLDAYHSPSARPLFTTNTLKILDNAIFSR